MRSKEGHDYSPRPLKRVSEAARMEQRPGQVLPDSTFAVQLAALCVVDLSVLNGQAVSEQDLNPNDIVDRNGTGKTPDK